MIFVHDVDEVFVRVKHGMVSFYDFPVISIVETENSSFIYYFIADFYVQWDQ